MSVSLSALDWATDGGLCPFHEVAVSKTMDRKRLLVAGEPSGERLKHFFETDCIADARSRSVHIRFQYEAREVYCLVN